MLLFNKKYFDSLAYMLQYPIKYCNISKGHVADLYFSYEIQISNKFCFFNWLS